MVDPCDFSDFAKSLRILNNVKSQGGADRKICGKLRFLVAKSNKIHDKKERRMEQKDFSVTQFFE